VGHAAGVHTLQDPGSFSAASGECENSKQRGKQVCLRPARQLNLAPRPWSRAWRCPTELSWRLRSPTAIRGRRTWAAPSWRVCWLTSGSPTASPTSSGMAPRRPPPAQPPQGGPSPTRCGGSSRWVQLSHFQPLNFQLFSESAFHSSRSGDSGRLRSSSRLRVYLDRFAENCKQRGKRSGGGRDDADENHGEPFEAVLPELWREEERQHDADGRWPALGAQDKRRKREEEQPRLGMHLALVVGLILRVRRQNMRKFESCERKKEEYSRIMAPPQSSRLDYSGI